MDLITLAAAKGYVGETADSLGAVKGAPATIKSITEIDGGHRVTFEWTGTSGTKQTSTLDVMNGVDGKDGKDGIGIKGDPGINGTDGVDGIGITSIAKTKTEGLVDTYTITFTDGSTFNYDVTNGKDGKDGSGSSTGEENVIESIKVNGVVQTVADDKSVDITVPTVDVDKNYVDTELAKKANTSDIPSLDDYAKSSDIPSKVSELENDSNYLSSIPEEYVTETELSAKGYLTEHQDISGKVDKVEGKSLISDTEIERLASVDNYDDTDIRTELAKKADATAIPSKVSELTNDSNYQTAEQVNSTVTTEIAKVVADAPEDLNTLKEMSDWIAGHEDDASAMNSAISDNKTAITALQTGKADKSEIPTTVAELTDSADYAKTVDVNESISTLQTGKADASDLTAHTGDVDIHVTAENKATWNTVSDKVDKEDGKGLSANDYTNEEKALVGTIEDKINKTSIVTALDDNVTDEQVTSALLAKTELDKKIDKTSIATELSDASTDDEVVGALTTYNELQKLESANKEQFGIASGDYITVNDSVDGNIIELSIKGNSFQKTYSGKNLLNNTLGTATQNGITCTNNGDGTYTLNGTATSEAVFGFIAEEKRKTLYNSVVGKTLKFLDGGFGTSNIGRFLLNIKGDDGNWWAKGEQYNGSVFTVLDGYSEIYVDLRIRKGSTLQNVLLKPMLTTDLDATNDDFEPYVGGIPSPNPLYPQAINSVGDDGSLVVKSCGKNLIPYPYYNGSDTRNGITVTVNNDDGSITLNGTATSNYFFVLLHRNANGKGFAKKLRGKTVTISGGTSRPVLSFAVYDEDGNNVTPPNNEMLYDYGSGVTVTIPDNACDMYSYYYFSSGNTVDVTLRPQLEVSDVVTVYEPYKSSTTAIPLSEPLRAIGDVKDEITYQDGKWGVLRRTGQYVIDGTENLILPSTNISDYGISVRLGDYTNILKGISVVSGNTRDMVTDYLGCRELDHVPYYDSSSTIDRGSGIYRTSGNIWLSFGASDIEKIGITKDVDSVKTWLSSHNITVHYPIGTPTFEPFADQSLPYLSTYDGVTNISNYDALSAEMTVKYPTTDASGVGSRNESRIAELAKDTDESLSSIGKCKNLLNPTLKNITQDGITCKNNGDGTYTLNGTCSVDSPKTTIILTYESMKIDEDVKFICCTQSGSSDTFRASVDYDDGTYSVDYGEGTLLSKGKTITKVSIIVSNGATVNNIVFKPMITTNISATYDDFVPYTGDGETLASDVAEIKKDLGGLTFSASGKTLTITDGTNTWTLGANS